MWSELRYLLMGGKKKSFSINDSFTRNTEYDSGFQGLSYPVFGRLNGKEEMIENDFVNYSRKAYKSDGVVFACMQARAMIFTEARFQWQRLEGGRPTDLWGDKALALLEEPWPNGSTGDLLSRAIQDVDLCGNHYVTNRDGRIRRLRPDWVKILLSGDPQKDLDFDVLGYLYQPGGFGTSLMSEGGTASKGRLYTVDEVAHWVPPGQTDPEAQYRGMTWLTTVIREVMADKAASAHKLKYFENAATPNIAVSLKDTVSREQFKEFMEEMDDSHKGVEHAYETLYLGGGADVSVIGADMKQMDFKVTQGAGETRVAAAARVHPVIVGLSEGMQGSSLNAGNFKAAKDSFGDGTMRPLWRSIAAAYAKLVKVPAGSRLWYDDRDIQFLRADLNQRAEVAQRDAAIFRQLTDGGWEPDSIKAAIKAGYDWDKLKHTGLVSVQLLPPGTVGTPPGAPAAGGKTPPKQPGRATGGKTPPGPPTSGSGDDENPTATAAPPSN